MKQRFEKKREEDKSTIMSDNEFLFIQVYDKMTIKVITSNEKKIMTLLNVIYISDFMINIVADSILKNKELHFNTQHRHLHRNDSTVVLIFRVELHYVFEDNKESKFKEMTAFATFIQADFTH